MTQLKIGIIGAGGGVGSSRGASFARVLQALGEDAKVTGICDIQREHADRGASEVGARAFYDYGEMLDSGLDAVVIATPLPFHAEQAVQALDKGVNVLSEVTACHDMDSAERLARAAAKSSAVYMLAENYRYFDEVELIKRMAEDGRFGELYNAEGEYLHDCRDLFRYPDGSLTWRGQGWPGTYCTHSLGPLLYILDDRLVRVMALDTGMPPRWDPGVGFPESTTFLGKTTRGAVVKVRVDYQSRRPHIMASYQLQGTAGCYESMRGLGDEAKVWLSDVHEPSRCWAPRGEPIAQWHPMAEFQERYIPERLAVGKEARLGGHGTSEYWLLKEFFAAVRGERESPIDVYRALDYTVPGICAVISAESGGRAVEVPDFRRLVQAG